MSLRIEKIELISSAKRGVPEPTTQAHSPGLPSYAARQRSPEAICRTNRAIHATSDGGTSPNSPNACPDAINAANDAALDDFRSDGGDSTCRGWMCWTSARLKD